VSFAQELDDKHASAVDLGEQYSEHQMLYRALALIMNLHSLSIFYLLLLKQRVKSFLFESGFETSNGPCRGIHPDEDVQLTATGDFEPIGWFGKGEIPFDIWRVRK